MTAKPASKPSKKPAAKTVVAKRTGTGKTPAAALRSIDFAGLAKEAAAKMAAKKVEPAKSPAPEAPKATKPAKSSKAPGLAALGRKPEGAPRAAALPADAKLTCVMKENPSRAGSAAFKARELYRSCKTVGAWRERVAASDLDPGYLVGDLRRGLIKVG